MFYIIYESEHYNKVGDNANKPEGSPTGVVGLPVGEDPAFERWRMVARRPQT